jgi:hypothetical protein
MFSGQYLRIQRQAGGVYASDRQLIKAARTKLKKSGLTRAKRRSRHAWLRALIEIHHHQQKKGF